MDEGNRDTATALKFSSPENGRLLVQLAGSWIMGQELPQAGTVMEHAHQQQGINHILFEHGALVDWDSSLLTFLINLQAACAADGIHLEMDGLPPGVVRLLSLANALKELEAPPDQPKHRGFLEVMGEWLLDASQNARLILEFTGESFLAVLRLLRGKARFRPRDLWILLYECGPQALPIVSLISLLVGIILAFVGAVQLRMFGAQIFIANLVGVAMVREMGAMMTAIIMMGRTGAAYATQLGTMEVNEEIDALRTLGISPLEFLVMPRMLALVLMAPLLYVYADLAGILGGALVGVMMFDLSPYQYWQQTLLAVNLNQFGLGISKSVVFAVLIAGAGCYQGMHAERNASAVGYAATRAVVAGIVLIVVVDGLFAVVTSILKV